MCALNCVSTKNINQTSFSEFVRPGLSHHVSRWKLEACLELAIRWRASGPGYRGVAQAHEPPATSSSILIWVLIITSKTCQYHQRITRLNPRDSTSIDLYLLCTVPTHATYSYDYLTPYLEVLCACARGVLERVSGSRAPAPAP